MSALRRIVLSPRERFTPPPCYPPPQAMFLETTKRHPLPAEFLRSWDDALLNIDTMDVTAFMECLQKHHVCPVLYFPCCCCQRAESWL